MHPLPSQHRLVSNGTPVEFTKATPRFNRSSIAIRTVTGRVATVVSNDERRSRAWLRLPAPDEKSLNILQPFSWLALHRASIQEGYPKPG